MVKVDGEFSAKLTVMGDEASLPWRLLELDVLVRDDELGEGKDLVHPSQLCYLHTLIQSRLMDNHEPLEQLYKIMRMSFWRAVSIDIYPLYGTCVEMRIFISTWRQYLDRRFFSMI